MSLKIFAVGDIMLGEQPLCNNFGVKKIIQSNGIDFFFEEISHLFQNGDIVFGNLECFFTNNSIDDKTSFFSANPEIVKGLKDAKINILSVANNHVLEGGCDSFINTIKILEENEITPIGVKNKYTLLKIKGHAISFLAYSFIEDDIPDTKYNKVQSEKTIIDDIQKLRPISDIIIVSLHWGCEYVPYPSPDQIQVGRMLVDAGADIILGSHPHVIQSYEIYKNRPILYSLGNFIFDQTFIPSARESCIVEINVNDALNSFNVDFYPILIDKKTYRPILLDQSYLGEFLIKNDIIRRTFENKSLSDYKTTIGDYNLLCNSKKQSAKWMMKVHFLKNFYRYSSLTIFKIIKQFVCMQNRVQQ